MCSSCTRRLRHKTPYFLLSSAVVYVSGLLWLILSLHGDHVGDNVTYSGWPDESHDWSPPFPLLVAITMAQITIGGMTMIETLGGRHIYSVAFNAVWIFIALLATSAYDVVIYAHTATYTVAVSLAAVDHSRIRSRAVGAQSAQGGPDEVSV